MNVLWILDLMCGGERVSTTKLETEPSPGEKVKRRNIMTDANKAMSKIYGLRKFRFSKVSGYIHLRIALTSPITTLTGKAFAPLQLQELIAFLKILINMSKDTI